MSQMSKEKVQTLMLAGGLGKRLDCMTGGFQPKCFVDLLPGYQAIDYVQEQLDKIGIQATRRNSSSYCSRLCFSI